MDYGNNAVEVGAAMLLDKATGVELGELERAGMLARTDARKRYSFWDRSSVQTCSTPVSSAPWRASRAWWTWPTRRRCSGKRTVAKSSPSCFQRRATPRDVLAQALAELQPSDASERKLLLGALGSWSTHQSSTTKGRPGKLKQGTLDI